MFTSYDIRETRTRLHRNAIVVITIHILLCAHKRVLHVAFVHLALGLFFLISNENDKTPDILISDIVAFLGWRNADSIRSRKPGAARANDLLLVVEIMKKKTTVIKFYHRT